MTSNLHVSTPQSNRRMPLRRRRAASVALVAVVALVASIVGLAAPHAAGQQGSLVVFDEGLGDGFTDWSWSGTTVDLASSTEVRTGSLALAADLAPYRALALGYFATATPPADAVLRFAAHGGDNAALRVRVVAMDGSFQAGTAVTIDVPGGEWTDFAIPLVDLGDPAVLGGVWWQEADGVDVTTFFLDDVEVGPAEVEPAPTPEPTPEPPGQWAFEESFDGDPASPSQELLPTNFDYSVTHRSHPGDHFDPYPSFPADHADNCAGPNPEIVPLPQHAVQTRQDSSGSDPDESFFICKNHMMSSMGQAGPYSVSAFWPKQEFNFAGGGVLEFDVNINDAHDVRSWWEVMIVPRDQLTVAAGPIDSPISETYPAERIVLDFRRNVRTIKVGTGAIAPDGWLANETQWGEYDFAWWRDLHPEDPALDDRRERRTMRVEIEGDRIVWGIETADGSFDEWSVAVPGGVPFDQGLVLFKTHAYNPVKDGNTDVYTFHWDNLRFDGPVVGQYDTYDADDVVYLQRNGDREVGESETVTIDIERLGSNPVLFGQIHQPKRGSVLLSVNGGPSIEVEPDRYERDDCASDHWVSFRLPLDGVELQAGENTFTWTIGEKPACATGVIDWVGFSIKGLQIQVD